jgi:hypothetical protein
MLIDKDTSICFSTSKSKFLLKQVYLVSEKDTLLKITESELKIANQQKLLLAQQVEAYQKIISNQQEISSNLLAVSSQKDEEIKALNKQITKQKVKTWVSIFGGVVSTAFVSYLWIKK